MIHEKKNKSLEDELFYIGLIFLVAGIILWFLFYFLLEKYLPTVPCFFSSVLGIYCPGCGGTRAVLALMQGRLFKSIWYHPLVPYGAILGGGFMLTQGMHRLGVKRVKGWKYHSWCLYAAVIILVCNFLIKNMLRLIWGITM